MSGLSTHVIRVWERRYGALQPDRSGGGARLYADAEIERLRLLRRAVEQGHTISQVATLPGDELARITGTPLSAGDDAAGRRAAPIEPARDPRATGAPRANTAPDLHLELSEFVGAVGDFDMERAERILDRAAIRLSPRAMIADVLAPALTLVGSAWASGALCVASEHLASALIRDRAGTMLRECSSDPGAETLVLTTPLGEHHELGALLAAVTVAMNGFRAVYLGPNLPASEIAVAAARTGAAVVALSLVSSSVPLALPEVEHLRRVLPAETLLLLGGSGAGAVASSLHGNVVVQPSLAQLEHWLLERRARAGAKSA